MALNSRARRNALSPIVATGVVLEFFASVLVLAGTIGLIVALISLIAPLQKLGIKTRKSAAGVLAASMVVGIVGGAFMPDTPASAGTPDPRAAHTPHAPAPEVADAAAAARAAHAAMEQGVVAGWRSVMAAVAPCDEANERMATTVAAVSDGNASIYDAYRRAEEGVTACQAAANDLDRISPPEGASGETQNEFSKALEMCRGAYVLRQTSLETARDIFDGDFRPSLVSRYRDQAENAQGGAMGCVTGYMSASLKAGVDPARLQTKG